MLNIDNAAKLQLGGAFDDRRTYRFHDLRHTAATMVADAGMEESVIAHLLGHGKTTVTRRYIKALHSQMLPALEGVETSIGLGGGMAKEKME